jgi:hypothetical protein
MSVLKSSKSTLRPGDRSGLALITTIIVLAVVGTVVAAMVTAVMASVRTSALEYHEGRAFYAAEAGGEVALAQIKLALQDGLLEDAELAAVQAPTMEGFNYDSFSVMKKGTPIVETITDGPYSGLYALTQDVEIVSLAEDPNGSIGGVILDAKAQAIPIFQFGVFFDDDLEATNGPPLEFVGRVHSNSNIYLSSGGGDDDSEPNAWYREMITTPNKVFNDRKDNHDIQTGVFINDAEGNEVRLEFDSRSIPDFEAFKTRSCDDFDCRLQTDAFEVDSLRLPLPEGVPPYEVIRPRDLDDGAAEKSVKFAWNADTYVTVDLVNLKSKGMVCDDGEDDPDDNFGGNKWWPDITIERDGSTVPNKPALCDIMRWEWAAFYDGREEEMKDVLTIDIQQLDDWIDGEESRATAVIYVEFVVPGGVSTYPQDVKDETLDATVDPALRLKSGSTLPNPMTVATDWPLYVEGDYNDSPKQPAALASDGLTILSEGWKDNENRPKNSDVNDCDGMVLAGSPCSGYEDWVPTWNMETASETTVNGAVLAGHWPTPCDHEVPPCAGGYADFYGGGIENFPRFLERWKSGSTRIIFHYLGALVSPFTSQKTTGTWNGTYYYPPQRDWGFDTDFRNPELLPPGTPNVGNVIRTAMREAF